MRFSPRQVIPAYRQLRPEHATPEEFARQMQICESCKERIRGQCRLARQRVTIVARQKACPLDPVKPKPKPKHETPRTQTQESAPSWLEGNF